MTGSVREVATTFDLTAFERALVACDIPELATCYADDADIRVVGDEHPPYAPLLVSGRQAISVWLATYAWPDLDREVVHLVDGGDRIAFTQCWRRTDGTVTLLTSTAELLDGLISVQHTLQDSSLDPTRRRSATALPRL